MSASLAEQLAALPGEDREAWLDDLSGEEHEALLADWRFWARPEQLPPDVAWFIWCIIAGRGFGKALALGTPLPDPTGWVRMGDVRRGDRLFDERGRPCTVSATFDVDAAEAWRLRFSDGTHLDACADHQWVTLDHLDRRGGPVPADWAERPPITTRHIVATLGARNHCIPLPNAALPVGPWVMIEAADPLPPQPMRCVTVDSPHHMYLAGDGMIPTHNTRSGAEWVLDRVEDPRPGVGQRLAALGRTAADYRDVMVEGESGLIECADRRRIRAQFVPSKRSVLFPEHGGAMTLYSAEEPESLRGAQHDTGWGDEPASWRQVVDSVGNTAWTNLLFGMRLGPDPRIVVTGTPKPVPLVRELVADARAGRNGTVRTGGALWENVANLAPTFVQLILERYAGTRLGDQEILGAVVDEVEGALWRQAVIERTRLTVSEALWLRGVRLAVDELVPGGLGRVVVGVDPPGDERGAECGIVGVASSARSLWTRRTGKRQRHAYVLGDWSRQGTPEQWGRAVVDAYRELDADLVVAERNNGGQMVAHTIHTVDPAVPVELVWASRGKRTRAEPFAALYDQGRGHHVGVLGELESQMTQWVPGDDSPDRMDACVWGLAELFADLLSSPVQVQRPTRGTLGSRSPLAG